jgi:hypothetical protein
MEEPVGLWAAATADLSAPLRDDKKGDAVMEKPAGLWAAGTADLSAALRDDKKGIGQQGTGSKTGPVREPADAEVF